MTRPSTAPRRSVHERSQAPALRGRAPAAPTRVPATWTTGAKDGIGTSFYRPESGPSLSNVWYTLTRGVLTEVYYPDVSCANVRLLQLAVTDGKSFTDVEEQDTSHDIKLLYPDALIYQQRNTAINKRYQLSKTYLTNPEQHALLMQVTFEALQGAIEDYKLFLYLNPTVDNGGQKVWAEVVRVEGGYALVSCAGDISMAVVTSAPMMEASTGYIGFSDGLDDLRQHFRLTNCYISAADGSISQIGGVQLPAGASASYETIQGHSGASEPSHSPQGRSRLATFQVAVGFGSNVEAALTAAKNSLQAAFEKVLTEYRKGWQDYLAGLTRPEIGSLEQYNVAAMVLKAHEDKRHPGAIVASLTIPWGDKVVSTEGGIGGYHLVWSRDFYQVASTLYAIGDKDFAMRALAYLDEVQQLADGSFPQNSWLDGTPYWRGLQLDEAAFPILLAYQTGDFTRYGSMVRPAADFIVENGPFTPQERWEENAGYSPSTIASEIAALVAAAEMAKHHRDYGRAAKYLGRADEWARKVEIWTVARAGSLSDEPYYMRISDTRNADDNHWIHIANGGGWRPKSSVVDAGFLELVRLGIKPADDALITHSLNVIDSQLKFEAVYGPVWKRYTYDGYGEQVDGSPYEGRGIGRPWPLLTGERGEYEVAFVHSHKRTQPDHLYGVEKLLFAMAGAANNGCLIPEQIWDGEDQPQRRLTAGQGTGSATPLAWAMAQYLRLCECIRQGRVVEMPEVVAQRYVNDPPPVGPAVEIEMPDFGVVSHTAQVILRGRTAPFATVVLSGAEDVVVQAGSDGSFSAEVSLWTVGKNAIPIVGYDNERSISMTHFLLFYEPELLWAVSDEPRDDFGPGWYQYPQHADFHQGDLDLWQVRVLVDSNDVYFDIELGRLDNPWEGPSGISKQLIDVYLFNPLLVEKIEMQTRGLNARFREGLGWNRMIRISGNWHNEARVYDANGSPLGSVRIMPQYTLRRISAAVALSALGGVPQTGWRIMVVTAGEENGGPRPIRKEAGQWDFGGGSDDSRNPLIVDLLVPTGEYQRNILDWHLVQGVVELPMIPL